MTKNKLLISLVCFLPLLFVLVFYFFNGVDVVKKETAKVFDFEYIPSQTRALESSIAFSSKDSVYKNFRKKFRYHYQGVSMASFSDSSRLWILSDPSPWVEIDSLQQLLTAFTHQIFVETHRIGYDGFSKDIVVVFTNASSENMVNLHKKLADYLFYTDYKPLVLDLNLPLKRVYFSDQSLDYQISLQEFNDWFLEQEEVFFEMRDTLKKYTVQKLFATQTSGVFFSQIPGFVAWSLPKKSDLTQHLSAIRKFCVDADLILGALADTSMLVIIGREREASVQELPPLQLESVLLLASVSEKELSQSLDVNDLMAGKRSDGKDWCPTYLSKELENTEFGHLMTITDVLLKDWSEKGTIKEAFYAYPEPPYYPFDAPLFRKLGINELVYNWNTANTMFAIDLDRATIYTLNRTGALPVSYFNSQSNSVSIGTTYENQASNYFAQLGNTDLARVVQYTALYQLFMDNQITYTGEVYGAFPKNKPYLLTETVRIFLDTIKKMSEPHVDSLSGSIASDNFEFYQKEQVFKQIRRYEKEGNYTYTQEDLDRICKEVQFKNKQRIKRGFIGVRAMLNALSADDFKKLCRDLAYPRGEFSYSKTMLQTKMRSRKVQDLAFNIGKLNFDKLGVDLKQVQNYFVNHLAKSSARYLKTASVIITFNDFLTTGGHNLSSKITRVNKMNGYKPLRRLPKGHEPKKPTQAQEVPVKTKEPLTKSKGIPGNPSEKSQPSGSSKDVWAKSQPPAEQLQGGKTSPKRTGANSNIRKRTEVVLGSPRTQRGL